MKSNFYRATQKRTGGARSRGAGVRDNVRLPVVYGDFTDSSGGDKPPPLRRCWRCVLNVDKWYLLVTIGHLRASRLRRNIDCTQ